MSFNASREVLATRFDDDVTMIGGTVAEGIVDTDTTVEEIKSGTVGRGTDSLNGGMYFLKSPFGDPVNTGVLVSLSSTLPSGTM